MASTQAIHVLYGWPGILNKETIILGISTADCSKYRKMFCHLFGSHCLVPTKAATNHWDAPMSPPKEKGHQKGAKKNQDHKINPQKSPNLKEKTHCLLSIQTFHLAGRCGGSKSQKKKNVSRPSWIFSPWKLRSSQDSSHASSKSGRWIFYIPKTNMEPKKYRFGRWCSFSKQWCSGSMLVFFSGSSTLCSIPLTPCNVTTVTPLSSNDTEAESPRLWSWYDSP